VTELIFSVTGRHELVGSIVEYLTSPVGLAPKLANGTVEPDVQSHAQALVIIALTGMRQPPLMDHCWIAGCLIATNGSTDCIPHCHLDTGVRQPPLMDEYSHLFSVNEWETARKQQGVLDAVRRFHRPYEALILIDCH
jgi:hypothetical protein